MRLDNEKPSDNVEDRRGQGGFGLPRGGSGGSRINIPLGGRGRGFSMSTIIVMIVIYLVFRFVFGVDLIQVLNGGGMQAPSGSTEVSRTDTDVGGASSANVTGEAGKDFVRRVLGSTERVWDGIFTKMGQQYEKPNLVLFTGIVQSACGTAQSAMGPFYCPGDKNVYIDLSFYQDMRDKLGAPGDAAQGYVIAHEVGHHLQNLFGVAEQVNQQRAQASEEEGNVLSVRMELQADCYAGIWANVSGVFEQGDIEEALNAASQIGDDRLQKRSQGYVVPESFTHGSSEQRARWFNTGFKATDINQCDTFGADQL
jgi:uncharacterized protein